MLLYINNVFKLLFFLTMILNWVLRIVEFNWYWYRQLNFWHCEIPSHPAAQLHWILGFSHLPNPTLTPGHKGTYTIYRNSRTTSR